jgi:hypothetical protein
MSSFISLSHAQDTSGCSPMLTQSQKQTTTKGSVLRLTSSKVNSSRCWNLNSSGISVSYEWNQVEPKAKYQKVGFWIKLGREEQYLKASSISCRNQNRYYLCSASGFVSIPNMNNWAIEIAPEVDNSWDTKGVGQNYFFNF